MIVSADPVTCRRELVVFRILCSTLWAHPSQFVDANSRMVQKTVNSPAGPLDASCAQCHHGSYSLALVPCVPERTWSSERLRTSTLLFSSQCRAIENSYLEGPSHRPLHKTSTSWKMFHIMISSIIIQCVLHVGTKHTPSLQWLTSLPLNFFLPEESSLNTKSYGPRAHDIWEPKPKPKQIEGQSQPVFEPSPTARGVPSFQTGPSRASEGPSPSLRPCNPSLVWEPPRRYAYIYIHIHMRNVYKYICICTYMFYMYMYMYMYIHVHPA